MALKHARRRHKGMYSNTISNYASSILIVAVAVVIVVSNHDWQTIFMVRMGSAS